MIHINTAGNECTFREFIPIEIINTVVNDKSLLGKWTSGDSVDSSFNTNWLNDELWVNEVLSITKIVQSTIINDDIAVVIFKDTTVDKSGVESHDCGIYRCVLR